MTTRKPQAAKATAVPATPAIDSNMMAAFQAFLAAQQAGAPAPAQKAKAEPAKPAPQVMDLSGVTLRATGASRPSSSGKTILVPVSGKLANGATVGGTLWVKP